MIDPDLMSIERQRNALMKRMKKFYERLTGSACEANFFCVSRTSLRGCYYVHRLDSCDFYEVNIREAVHGAG